MRRLILIVLVLLVNFAWAQESPKWQGKFEQLEQALPTPNEYRTGSGSPGPKYWQQQADYVISVELNDDNQTINGTETITYHNNSPDVLKYLWLQLDQNVLSDDNTLKSTSTSAVKDSAAAKTFAAQVSDFKAGFNIKAVKDASGKGLPFTINNTMMRVDLPQPLKSGEKVSFNVDWSFNIVDRSIYGQRSGLEFFPEDGNYVYTIAQFFPRMCVYDDYQGWQNKQFLGRGEFTLPFGNYKVRITVPADHIIAATGVLQNPQDVLTKAEIERFEKAKKSFDKPVIIVTQSEATAKEKTKSKQKKTWEYHADNVRDFAFASSRKFIWDAQAVRIGNKTPLAMSYYPKEGNPLWEQESTKAVKNTLEVYSKFTIDYPYPVAISVHAASIGMEYPMICFNFGRPKKDGTYTPQLKQGMIGVIVHEVGHNFFPMIINNDERQTTWMDEGVNSFVQLMTELERYPDIDWSRGKPSGIVQYMKGDKNLMRPLMTNSEQVIQFGPEQYAKAATALYILRETVMGPQLFDAAFKEYAQRWAFKHPKPADFFRTMEDASAVDLDWFWKGWFYTTDVTDQTLEQVKWFKLRNDKSKPESKNVKTKKGDLAAQGTTDKKYDNFSNGPEEFSLIETDPQFYGEFRSRVDDKGIMAKLENKNIYEVTISNKGGLVMPVIIEWTYKDGTKELEKIPAEIWRINEQKVTKVFVKDKEVTNIMVDPNLETADVNIEDNIFPKVQRDSKFDEFKKKN
ncbi:M1 family metallopeptidase [Chryseosolibacter indicus]|uniref:M1 family metallopeptidase n=1 Tax=Chryseosolibacter indicus TaxID=2782351 RepID=A0ABS5VU42_9BACT|nr:M1 family metallopeptidase [Chryseosolibacter indicus]MBT1704360.1 M1 family metallopeptidase [Chryseosolibacter indicus]